MQISASTNLEVLAVLSTASPQIEVGNIARQLSCDEKRIRMALEKLEGMGFVISSKKYNGLPGMLNRNLYSITGKGMSRYTDVKIQIEGIVKNVLCDLR